MEQNENQDSIRERIRAYAFDLKLPLVRRDIDLLIQQGLDERWNLWMFTAELLRQEKENRSENQRRHRIKNAAFPQLRYLNEIDTDALPPEARKALPNLETLDFIKEGRNLILYGNPGTGKTHLATALGIAACNAGYSVLFTSVPRLLTQIRECRNAMTLRALENKFERYDMVICDTAGRLHNKKNLMDELSKISRVVHKACGTASVETLLVLDAITGQNAISQASQFIDAAGATGIVLTKLDGTAKGGAVISIKAKLGLPVRFVGVGEGMDDLMEFDPDAFVDALFLREE